MWYFTISKCKKFVDILVPFLNHRLETSMTGHKNRGDTIQKRSFHAIDIIFWINAPLNFSSDRNSSTYTCFLLLPNLQRKIHLVPNFKVIFQYFQRRSQVPKFNTMILSKKLTIHYTLPDHGCVFEIWFWEVTTLVRFFSFKFHSNSYFNDLDRKRMHFLTDIFEKSFKKFTFWNIKLKYFMHGFSRN